MSENGESRKKEQPRLFARAELYRILANVLLEKKPLPPPEWSVVKFDREVGFAGREYDPDLFSRHHDALTDSIYYLTDFAARMPEWIDLSINTQRVDEICGDIADEIEQITYEPEAVIARHGNSKSWLKAILAVQTCLVYQAETARVIFEKEAEKRHRRIPTSPPKSSPAQTKSSDKKWQSALAQEIFEKVSGRQNAAEQPSLF